MPIDYLPILILVVLATAFAAIAIVVGTVMGPKKPAKDKLFTYEAGKIPFGGPWEKRISIRYYMTAVLFLLFDVEVLFLYPWAVVLRRLKLFGLLEMAVFMVILLVGYVYVWRKGAFEWD
jgi:NADH-quinone oxidoreductase subunit A